MDTAAANKIIELANHIARAALVGRGKRESRYLENTRHRVILGCAFKIIKLARKKTQ
jgi:hypothetical protein